MFTYLLRKFENRNKSFYSFLACLFLTSFQSNAEFRAGVFSVDVSPQKLPVIRNGSFLENTADKVLDPLHARCFVFAEGGRQLAIVIVDSCMIPRTVADKAKSIAMTQTGIPVNRILISATHCHSAPSVMNYCLGSRADPEYTKLLPGKIAEAIQKAQQALQPAQAGWGSVDAGEFTSVRRWITRPDKTQKDPFGNETVRAMMHPGYQNPDYIMPSGPEDPELSLLSILTAEGKPLGVLANFSMHYFGGHPGLSADYCGAFSKRLEQILAGNSKEFMAAMSQGTSGDLWWGDYSRSKKRTWSLDEYTGKLTQLAMGVLEKIQYSNSPSVVMAEKRIRLNRRLPDQDRVEWAEKLLQNFNPKETRPRNRPEVYAEQVFYHIENSSEEIVLQALRIGEMGITAIPCEIYALTGLKLKLQSPLQNTFNISLANGAAGYIPPPEQHRFGGYTTWPARTAGLETQAEPIIVETVLKLLEEVSGQPAKHYREPLSRYARSILNDKPSVFWRVGEMSGDKALDASGNDRHATYEGMIAFHLKGIESGPTESSKNSRSAYFSSGSLSVNLSEVQDDYTLEFWLWNGLSGKQRSEPGQLYSYLGDSVFITPQNHEHPGRIQFGSLIGKNEIESNQWTHLAFVRRKNTVNVYLNGSSSSDISATYALKDSLDKTLMIGSIFEGPHQQSTEAKLDEISIFNRALTIQEIQKHVRSGAVAGMMKEPNPLPDSPPLSPENSMELTHVRSGYTLELVAAEPLVKDPVAIDWGSDGRLWVAEMADYPYGMNGKGSPGGRIRYLQDRDSDGVYDHSTLFMDKLTFPTGVLEWKKGILVTAAPEIFYAEDTDGDGRADKKIVLFEGFMTGNQQLRVNGLRWGPDNWIYCASGGHHAGFGASNEIKSLIAEQRIPLGSRDFRFQPDKGLLEPRSGPSQFGRVRDNWGNWFGVQNSFPLWHYVLEDHYLTRNPHLAIGDTRNQLRGRANPKVFIASTPQKRFHSYEQSGRFTSACGPSLYRDSLLFPGSDTLHAFTCEPFHNVVQHSLLRKDGVSFSGQRDPDDGAMDFFTSADRWSRPVMSRTGPDGALWIVDMYRYMIEHPDWLPANGRDELKPFYRSGEELGRIYRIYPDGKRPVVAARLSEMTPLKLVKQFNHSNGIIRDRAQQLLVTNCEISVVPNLEKMLRNHLNPLSRFHALCTLQGLQKLTSDLLLVALDDTVPEIRRQALITAEKFNDNSDILVSKVCRMVKDPDPTVLLQLALSLGEWDEPEAGKALAEIARIPDLDPYLQMAVMTSAEKHYDTLVQSFIDSGIIPGGTILKTVLSMGLSSKSFLLDDLLLEVFSKIPTVGETQPLKLLHTWQNVLHEEGLTTDSLGTGPYAFLKNSGNSVRDFLKNVEQWTTDSTIPIGIRSNAILALGRTPTLRQNHMIRLEHCLHPSMPSELQSAAVRSLTQIQTYEAANLILGKWMEITPELRRTVLENILGRKQMADSLLDHLQNSDITTNDIETVYRKRLLNHQDESIAKKARRIFSSIAETPPNPDTRAFPEALALSGDTQKGLSVFTQRCSACHRENDNENSVGPELSSITDRSSESLLFSILNPSDSVEPKYIAYDFILNNEESFQGLIETESGNSLSIRLSDGSLKTILRQSIQSVRSQKQSLMPEGLAEGLSGQQMADLLAYVQQMD